MTRAVLYGRVSGDDRNKTGGENLRDQLRLCRDHAQERGYAVAAELAEDDRGASGATFDLPQLSRVLEMARGGEFSVLIVRELDRLSRDLTKQLVVEQELMRAGVSIEYVLYDFPDTPEGRLNKNLRAMLAEYEREKIKQRMMRGRVRMAKAGEVLNGGRPPFGYRNIILDGKKAMEINSEEARTVRLIFAWYTRGDGERGPMSIRALAKELTRLCVPTYADLRNPKNCTAKTAAKRGQWGASSVARILSNETYAGTWHYGPDSGDREPIAVAVPAIIDDEMWAVTQARRKRNKARAQRNRKYEYLLAGHLTCSDCGRRVAGKPTHNPAGKLILYYGCQATKRGFDCPMGYTSFPVAEADAQAWQWVRGLMVDSDQLEASLRRYQEERVALTEPLRTRLAIVEDLVQEKRARLERLLELYLSGEYSRDTLNELKAQEEAVLAGLQEERRQIAARLTHQTLAEDRLQSVLVFAARIRNGIAEADRSFEKRRQLLEALGLTGEVAVEDGDKVLYLHCMVGDFRSVIVSTSSIASASPTRAHLIYRF